MTRRRRPAFTFNVDQALELTGAGARIMLGLFIVTQVTLALVSGGEPMRSWRGWLALALVIAAAVLAVTPGRYPMPISWTAGVLAVVAVSTVLMNWSLDTHSWPGYIGWHFGANTFLLLAVAWRGRAGWAWVGMGIMTAATLAWSIGTGQGPMPAVNLLDRQVGTLLIGTLFAFVLSRTMRSLHELATAQNARAAEDEAVLAAGQVREQRMAWLEQTATPALESIVDGRAVGAEQQAELLITEGLLRDAIRGGILAREPVLSSITDARRRGVDVVLLDDSAGTELPNDDEAATLAWVAGQVDLVGMGAVTARISASESALIVSVVSDRSGQQTREIPLVARVEQSLFATPE